MMCRFLSNALFLTGMGFLGLAAYDYFMPQPGPQLEVAQADVEADDLSPGKEATVVFQLDNRSGRPLRVLGVTTC